MRRSSVRSSCSQLACSRRPSCRPTPLAAPGASAPAAGTTAAVGSAPTPPLSLTTLLAETPLERFVVLFALQGTSSAIRHEACAVLHALWLHATVAERSVLFIALRAQMAGLPLYGANSRELMTMVGGMMSAGEMESDMTMQMLDALLGNLKEQNSLLANHPNSYIYNQLGAALEIDGHFLESEPLHASNQPELPSQQVKLDALKAETKFTESCQIVKFAGSNTIHSGVLRIADIRRTSMVSTIHLYCNNKPVNDVGELKNRWELWKRVKTLQVPPAQAEIRFEFTIPVVATNLLIEYAAFHESSSGVSEKLQCPRCSRTVTDKHGNCKHCGDNAYQCRHCRNINYEKLDAFLCNECGFCKHARFDFSLVVRPSYVVERITNEAEREKLLALIDTELANASKRYTQLVNLKRPLERLLGQPADAITQLIAAGGGADGGGMVSLGSAAAALASASGGAAGTGTGPSPSAAGDPTETLLASLPGAATLRIQRKISILAMLYSRESKAAYESLSKSAQVLQAARAELLRYLQSNAAGPQPTAALAERQAAALSRDLGSFQDLAGLGGGDAGSRSLADGARVGSEVGGRAAANDEVDGIVTDSPAVPPTAASTARRPMCSSASGCSSRLEVVQSRARACARR